MPLSKQKASEEGRRRGIVLGLTIAEIILLILFAVVLAMAGVLVKRQAKIESQTEQRLLAEKQKAKADPAVYQLGTDFQKYFGKDKTVLQVSDEFKKLQFDFDKLKAEIAKTVSLEVLPACLRAANGGNIPYIFDISIRNDGMTLYDTSPDRLKAQLRTDFPNPLALGQALSMSDFRAATIPYINYGKRSQCKFYVKVYDETQGNKEKFKSQLKVIESNFVWTFMMSTKPGSQNGADLNLFQTAPLK